MVKLMEVLAPKPGIALQFFHDHWRHPHATWGTLMDAVTATSLGHRFDTPHLPDRQSRFEGNLDVSFKDVSDCLTLNDHPVYKNHMAEDAFVFVDLASTVFLFVDEEAIQAGPRATEEDGTATYAWRWEQRPVAVKLVQMIEQDGPQHWAADDDLELGWRIGATRHVRSRPNPTMHPDGPAAEGFRELWWPTYTDFETGIAHDRAAFESLLSRPAKSYAGLFHVERFPI